MQNPELFACLSKERKENLLETLLFRPSIYERLYYEEEMVRKQIVCYEEFLQIVRNPQIRAAAPEIDFEFEEFSANSYLSLVDEYLYWNKVPGENSFDAEARLFKGSTWEEDWYVSSTVPQRYELYYRGGLNVRSRWDDPTVLWSSEGSSIGEMSSTTNYLKDFHSLYNTPRDHDLTKTFNYRCVRNLGIAPDSDKIPQDFAKYENGTLSLEYLNEKSIRAYTQEAELPEHHERLPWWNFEVNSTSHQLRTGPANWIEIRNAINTGHSPCPPGWRVPNQRELALMLSRVGNDNKWTLNNHMSRTRFSMNPQGAYRHGFSVTNQAGKLFLINNSDEKGGVRCVRDKSSK